MVQFRSISLKAAGMLLGAVSLLFPPLISATPRIVMVVPDTTAHANANDGWLYIRMDNNDDLIAGFQFVLRSTRPDIVKFRFGPGTIDTSGTLTSGFEYYQVINKAGDSSEYWLRCIYDLPVPVGHHPPIPIQQGGIAAKVPFRTYFHPAESLSVEALIVFDKPTDFSDPVGNSIGAYACYEYDTLFWHCDEYLDDSCVSATQVFDTTLGYDFSTIDTTVFGCLDSSITLVVDGSVTVRLIPCDNNVSGGLDIVDLNCMVAYFFGGYNPVACPLIGCDANSNGIINVVDLNYLVRYFFLGGDPPPQ